MLTQTACEFWVIVSDRTPPFPGPSRLPFLIEQVDNDPTSAKFELTHPFDEKVKKFSSPEEAKMYLNKLRKKEWFTTPHIPDDELVNCAPFKVTCDVEMCEKPSDKLKEKLKKGDDE